MTTDIFDFTDFYTVYTPDMAAKDSAMSARGADGIRRENLKKLENGSYVRRVLPGKPGATSYMARRYTHFLKTTDGNWKPTQCPRSGAGQVCKICEAIAALRATGSSIDEKLASDMECALSHVLACLDVEMTFDPKEPLDSFLFLETSSKTVVQGLHDFQNNPRKGGDFTHPVKGFPLVFSKSNGPGGNPQYKVESSPAYLPGMLHTDPEVVRFFLKNAPDVRSEVALPSPEEQMEVLTMMGLQGVLSGNTRSVRDVANSFGAGPRR